jgi:hypothetical protein
VFYPLTPFLFLAQIMSTLLKAAPSPDEILALPEAAKITCFLQSQLQSQGGVVGFGM